MPAEERRCQWCRRRLVRVLHVGTDTEQVWWYCRVCDPHLSTHPAGGPAEAG